MTTPSVYPLCWPPHIGRTRSPLRTKSQFRSTLPAALSNVRKSIEGFAKDSGKNVTGIILSSNCTLGNDVPSDPGVAIWFVWDGMQVCFPVDRYLRPEENLQAIHHIIEARRVELRHGTMELVRATMTGLKALPPPPDYKPWWMVLGFASDAVTLQRVEDRFRELAAKHHPDVAGGNAELMTKINLAVAEARKALR